MGEQLSFDLAEGDPTSPLARPAVEPPDAPARHRIATDTGSTLFVDAGAGAGKTTALVRRMLTLIDEGVPIEAIAAITFTEKAAAELRHRLRRELGDGPASDERRRALAALDHAPVGTLHAFARRLLSEFPVESGLPPGFDVLDELESQLALGERWEDLQDELLDDAHREVSPGLTAAELVVLCESPPFKTVRSLRGIVEDFQANWDLVEERVERRPPPRIDVDVSDLVAGAGALAEVTVPPDDRQVIHVARIVAAGRALGDAEGVDQMAALEALVAACGKPDSVGAKGKWKRFGDEAGLDELRRREHELIAAAGAALARWREYRRAVVGAIAAHAVLDAAEARARAGTLEFHDLLVHARRLLTRHEGARIALHDRYRRVLLDEFQDTDPIQLEIAIRLTAPPRRQPDDVTALRPEPGRLFVVGDPKQSIYRFRRADIAAYLRAADQIGADEVALSANFRSSRAVIDWVNGVFADAIRAQPDVQPAYRPLDVARQGPTGHGRVVVVGVDAHVDDPDAEEVRRREADEVAGAVASALRDGWLVGDEDVEGGLRPCRPGDIAVLLPARTSLPALERALAERGVPSRAENASVVYAATEIRHLMLALRGAADPTDELAIVAALRSPLYGCSDVELYDWKVGGGRWNPFASPPPALTDHPVAAALAHLRTIAEAANRSAPAELIDRLARERRVLEVGLAGPRVRDVWRRLRFVVDQARAWTEAGGRGLRHYLAWAQYQAAEGRASDTILPERDHDAVRIMTVHAAKGLEFPICVVSGLTTRNTGPRRLSVVWPPGEWTLSEREDTVFEQFKPLDEQMSDAERRRLLYVACTRAVDHLVVSLHRKPESPTGDPQLWTSASVLAAAGGAGFGAVPAEASPGPLTSAAADAVELPWADPVAWADERARARRDGSRRTASSATRLAATIALPDRPGDEPRTGEVVEPDDADLLSLTVDAGLAKDPVDLDLPPWQRGRYGTAVGRAVHAVLQDVDLATGDDLEELAASHAAAEGIFGLEPHVAALARSALAAPIVGLAAAGADHWRELFVVTELHGLVLEGYVDLLVRTSEGLVIVDYKTDQFASDADRDDRLARYRIQLAAYGVALGRLLDEPIAGAVLVHCRVGGAAEQLDVPDWAAARAGVEAAVTAG